REIHGNLADYLVHVVQRAKRIRSIVASRNSVKDSDLRFFLALLLNLPSRTWIFRLIEERFPEETPQDLCLRWLQRIGDEEKLSNAFFELAQKAQLGLDRFGARLRAALPFESKDARNEAILR